MDHNSLRRVDRGWAETPPGRCPNGHTLGPRQVLVGSYVCSCEVHHHRTHRCRTCDSVTYTPPLGPDCQDSSFDGRATERGSDGQQARSEQCGNLETETDNREKHAASRIT